MNLDRAYASDGLTYAQQERLEDRATEKRETDLQYLKDGIREVFMNWQGWRGVMFNDPIWPTPCDGKTFRTQEQIADHLIGFLEEVVDDRIAESMQ